MISAPGFCAKMITSSRLFIMLRSILIYLSQAAWVQQIVPRGAIAWRTASRFVAGEKLEDAIRTVEKLNTIGVNATLDHLGEHTTTTDRAKNATEDILNILQTIARSGVRSNVSIKLTQIGLALDENLCAVNLANIVESAREVGNFVRIDMEDSQWVDTTLKLYRHMRSECGFTNVGVVIQSYLYRSDEDIRLLSKSRARVRLCKGAYMEPREISYPKKKDVDSSYDRLAQILIAEAQAAGSLPLSVDGKIPPLPALATHDPQRIENAKAYAQKISLPKNTLEFQFLYGIRRDLQEQLAEEGYPVRVYVPYGTEWYQYYMRRLAERPANLWFFISNFFRKY